MRGADHHPFWDVTINTFVYAADLHFGDKVRGSDGASLAVTAARSYDADLTAYNLTVDDIHTYYAGTAPVLVHNSDLCRAATEPVRAYDVGTYRQLKSRSTVGDQLDIQHVRQAQPGGQVIPGHVYGDAPAIALPAEEHALIPNLKGAYTGTPGNLLRRDIKNLQNFTNAPESAMQNLRDLTQRTFPDSYGES